jgi:nematocidal protein AidA
MISNLSSSNNVINVAVIIDAQSIIDQVSNPSQDPKNPTGLNHTFMYMVATRGNTMVGSGTADLVISANVGDVIRWSAESDSSNFDASTLIYGLPQYGGDTVFSNPTFKMFTRTSMQPVNNTIFPVVFVPQKYWFMQADIEATGSEQYGIQFAIYNRPSGGAQQLYGYFWWDPTLTINN